MVSTPTAQTICRTSRIQQLELSKTAVLVQRRILSSYLSWCLRSFGIPVVSTTRHCGQAMARSHLSSVWVIGKHRFLDLIVRFRWLELSWSTGYGQHGDYVFGWKGDVLQKAMEGSCFGASCSTLKSQSFSDANKCAVPDTVKEDVNGCKSGLTFLGLFYLSLIPDFF